MIATDVHQHLWSERLLALLATRTRPPSLRRAGGEWILRLDGEAEAPVDLAAHRPEARGAPLLVHPGPAPWGTRRRGADDVPGWWPALAAYVAQMNAAWHAFVAWGRPAHPALRVVFTMLAGGAPLHLERLDARGGPADAAHDRGLFYDTSSYGARAIDAMVRSVGIDQLVHGSDLPVIARPASAPLGEAAEVAMR